MRIFLRFTTLTAALLMPMWALPGCSSDEQAGGKMDGGAMSSGKMDGGAMDKGTMDSGAMKKGKMEGPSN